MASPGFDPKAGGEEVRFLLDLMAELPTLPPDKLRAHMLELVKRGILSQDQLDDFNSLIEAIEADPNGAGGKAAREGLVKALVPLLEGRLDAILGGRGVPGEPTLRMGREVDPLSGADLLLGRAGVDVGAIRATLAPIFVTSGAPGIAVEQQIQNILEELGRVLRERAKSARKIEANLEEIATQLKKQLEKYLEENPDLRALNVQTELVDYISRVVLEVDLAHQKFSRATAA